MTPFLRLSTTLLAALLPCAVAAACASTSGKGSETHFVCAADADCTGATHCVAGVCVGKNAEAGGGTGGSGGGVQPSGGAAGGGAAGGGAAGADTGAPKDAGVACELVEPRMPCNDEGIDCIADLRAVAARFATCYMVTSGIPFLARCGAYDAVITDGIDWQYRQYFDHSDGHFVATGNFGMTDNRPPCQALEPGFTFPACELPAQCKPDVPACADPGDAGAPPTFCPMAAFPRPTPGTRPRPGLETADSFTLKFVEGSHVRMGTDGWLSIVPSAMLDEDPGILRCAGLTVETARCNVSAAHWVQMFREVRVTPLFDRPPATLDQERAQGRQMGGEYLNDLNLYYMVTAPAETLPSIYDALAKNRLVDTVYYNPIPMPAGTP